MPFRDFLRVVLGMLYFDLRQSFKKPNHLTRCDSTVPRWRCRGCWAKDNLLKHDVCETGQLSLVTGHTW